MHSRTLVTVDIPEVKTDIETDREIQNTISDLETALERCDKDSIGSKIMNRIYLGRFKGMSNTFARAVYQAVDELLEPYLSLQLPLTGLLKQLNIKTNKMKIQVRRMKNDL